MAELAERSIVRKIVTILQFASSGQKKTPKELSVDISNARRIEFSYFRPAGARRIKLEYSEPNAILSKIHFAVALKVLNKDGSPAVGKKDFASHDKAVVLLSERAKDLLASSNVSISSILKIARRLLRRNPPQLPTAMKLFADCRPKGLSFKWFRSCLSILLHERDGALGASARRIYIPRPPEHQPPGEIGE